MSTKKEERYKYLKSDRYAFNNSGGGKIGWHTVSFAQYNEIIDGGYIGKGFGNKVMVKYNDKDQLDSHSMGRWPVYAVRGKPFPKDIAHKVIHIMDEYTRYLSPYEMANSNNGIIDMAKELGVKPKYMPHFSGHDLSWFPHPDEQKCGWLHPDGYVGITGQLSIKNPFPDETIIEWAEMLEKVLTTPEEQAAIDIVVVYTDLEENFVPPIPFEYFITTGYHIVGNTIEVLGSTKARLLFKKYDRLYGDHTKNGPLIDPRKYDESLLHHYHKHTSLKSDGKDKGIWRDNWTGFKYMFSWGEREQLKPLPEMIDKNHPLYYGPTDYNFKVGGPLTIADLREFLLEFKQEQDAAGETDIETEAEKHYKEEVERKKKRDEEWEQIKAEREAEEQKRKQSPTGEKQEEVIFDTLK